jgi:colanic acid biosynthesis protein WcaH
MEAETFLRIIADAPLVSIDLIVLDARGRVLLGRRVNRPAQGYWFVPGGRIHKDERLAQAYRRIARAELGLELDIAEAKLLGAYDHIYPDNFHGVPGITTHYVCLGYRCRLPEGARVTPDDQHDEMRWWTVDDLLAADDVHENTKAYFRR